MTTAQTLDPRVAAVTKGFVPEYEARAILEARRELAKLGADDHLDNARLTYHGTLELAFAGLNLEAFYGLPPVVAGTQARCWMISGKDLPSWRN